MVDVVLEDGLFLHLLLVLGLDLLDLLLVNVQRTEILAGITNVVKVLVEEGGLDYGADEVHYY